MHRSQSLLVVDDDSEILTVCAAALRLDGYHVDEAHGGGEALEKLSAHYDIILTDLMMPDVDGIGVLRGVKSRSPSSDVIIMTASPSLDSAIAALKEGAYDYLRKPFKKEELRAVVRRCADVRVAKEDLATERHLREELQAAYGELKKMEKLREGFICRVSHELRTPLAQVVGCLEMLERHREDPACTSDRLASAIQGAHRLREVVEDIVRFAEIQDPDTEIHKRELDLKPVIEKVLEETAPEWKARGLSVAKRWDGENCSRVHADAEMMERALRHLVVNAIRFNKHGGAIEISLERRADGVEIAVRDTGEGVPADQRLTIFDAFYQIAEFMTRKVRGLGLGLALVKRIAEAHGGSVSVESTPGEGSTFRLKLPA